MMYQGLFVKHQFAFEQIQFVIDHITDQILISYLMVCQVSNQLKNPCEFTCHFTRNVLSFSCISIAINPLPFVVNLVVYGIFIVLASFFCS